MFSSFYHLDTFQASCLGPMYVILELYAVFMFYL